MKTPFYPEHYDIIDGVKVYSFMIGFDAPTKKKTHTSLKKILAYAFYPLALVGLEVEDSFCRVVADLIVSRRRAQRCSSKELSY